MHYSVFMHCLSIARNLFFMFVSSSITFLFFVIQAQHTAMPEGGSMMWIGILLLCFILPAVLTYIFGEVLRKMGWIKDGDLKLDL